MLKCVSNKKKRCIDKRHKTEKTRMVPEHITNNRTVSAEILQNAVL